MRAASTTETRRDKANYMGTGFSRSQVEANAQEWLRDVRLQEGDHKEATGYITDVQLPDGSVIKEFLPKQDAIANGRKILHYNKVMGWEEEVDLGGGEVQKQWKEKTISDHIDTNSTDEELLRYYYDALRSKKALYVGSRQINDPKKNKTTGPYIPGE